MPFLRQRQKVKGVGDTRRSLFFCSILLLAFLTPMGVLAQRQLIDSGGGSSDQAPVGSGGGLSDQDKMVQWTCALRFSEPVMENNQPKEEVCLNLKKAENVEASNTEGARVQCYDFCSRLIYRRQSDQALIAPTSCIFITTLSCQELDEPGRRARATSEIPREEAAALNQLRGIGTPSQFIGRIIKTALGIIGTIALLIFIYAGLIWMIDRGNADKAQQSRKTIIWASLGVVTILTSYIVVDFVFQAFR